MVIRALVFIAPHALVLVIVLNNAINVVVQKAMQKKLQKILFAQIAGEKDIKRTNLIIESKKKEMNKTIIFEFQKLIYRKEQLFREEF